MPMLYYGQETGMTHFRKPMEWGGDTELTRFHRQLVHLRNDRAALRRGALQEVSWSGDDDVVAFAREHDGERVVVALHFGDGESEVTIDEPVETVDRLSGEDVAIEADGSSTFVSVDSVVVLDA